jgi:hypothetical protein
MCNRLSSIQLHTINILTWTAPLPFRSLIANSLVQITLTKKKLLRNEEKRKLKYEYVF